MVEGQKIEKVGPGVVHLVLGVVIFKPQCARPLAEIDRQTAANRRYGRPIRLEDGPIGLGPVLIYSAALKGLSCLTILQVKAHPKSPACRHVGRPLNHHSRLIQAKAVTQHVECPQQIDAAHRFIEVVAVVSVESEVEACPPDEIEQVAVVFTDTPSTLTDTRSTLLTDKRRAVIMRTGLGPARCGGAIRCRLARLTCHLISAWHGHRPNCCRWMLGKFSRSVATQSSFQVGEPALEFFYPFQQQPLSFERAGALVC